MLTTAGSNFEGWRITDYRGTLSTDAVVGSGIPAEVDAIVPDLTDQRSLLLASKMERAKKIAWNELLFRAHEAGANGILGVRYAVYMLPEHLFGASVTGTAVLLKKLSAARRRPAQEPLRCLRHRYRRKAGERVNSNGQSQSAQRPKRLQPVAGKEVFAIFYEIFFQIGNGKAHIPAGGLLDDLALDEYPAIGSQRRRIHTEPLGDHSRGAHAVVLGLKK